MTAFTVGQTVVIDRTRCWQDKGIEITKIARVMKRFVECTNGQKWQIDGYKPYGNDDRLYRGPHLRALVVEDENQLARQNIIKRLSARREEDWQSLTLDQLTRIDRIVKETGDG